MATYSISTTPRQDAVLATVALKRGVSVQQLMDAELGRVLRRAQNEAEQDDAAAVASAFTAATAAKQNAVRTTLGL